MLFWRLIISLPELSTHLGPMFPFFTPRTHRRNKRVSAIYKGCRKRTFSWNWLATEYLFCFCFHFVFWFVSSLSILKGPTLYWDEIISRLFHLNEICDSIVTDPAIKMCLGSHRTRKKLDYQFTVVCYFSRSRMPSFSIYLTWQMMTSP